jgi:hypothetical protein
MRAQGLKERLAGCVQLCRVHSGAALATVSTCSRTRAPTGVGLLRSTWRQRESRRRLTLHGRAGRIREHDDGPIAGREVHPARGHTAP